jgi:hypothetical protein
MRSSLVEERECDPVFSERGITIAKRASFAARILGGAGYAVVLARFKRAFL